MSYPPSSVTEHWPKDVSHSIALKGRGAAVAGPPIRKFEALENNKLVTREDATTGLETPEPIEQARDIHFDDQSNNKLLYPPNSLKIDGDRKSMRMWSAQVRVQKYATAEICPGISSNRRSNETVQIYI